MIVAAPGKLRLHRAGQTIPIPVVVHGRVIIGGVIVRVSVVVVGVPPIRKTKRNEVKSEEEPVVMVKEMVVPVVVKESMVSETMVSETMVSETMVSETMVSETVPNIVPRSKLMTRSVSRGTMSSTSRESSTAMAGHGARRCDRKRGGNGRCR